MAIGLIATPERASAQAIQATETIVSGDVLREPQGPGQDRIEVNSATAVLEWTPDEDGAGNALDFLPVGSTVTFAGGPSVSDFALLNIILPATNGNVTVFDGTVISQLIDPMTGAASPGGTVVFYSPSGIFVGDNAVFDVGNLILTTLEPDLASFDAFATAGGTLIQGGTPTTATIAINPGAQITASAENSYFAVTAAEISMLGTADINGSHAYVAGEAVNLTVSNGLFDIEIPVGTSAANAITLDGNVGGPSSTGVGDNHLIYAVAAAQNDPISMIFSGNLGFDPAASAGIVNGEIILSANYEVNGRDVDGGSITDGDAALFDADSALTDTPGSIFLEDFTSTSSILAVANEEVQVTAFNGPSSIDGNLIAVGRNFAELTASNNQTFGITGDVFVSADDFGRVDTSVPPAEFDAVAGTAFIDAFDGGILNIGGNALVSARAVAGVDTDTLEAGSATGGSATVASTGGQLTITGDVSVEANASEAQIAEDYLFGNVFTGGTAQIFAIQGGSVVIGGNVFANAFARGTTGSDVNPSTSSDAFGGLVAVQTQNGSGIIIGADTFLDASAIAGRSNDTAAGGLADAGEIFVTLGADGLIDLQGNLTLLANGEGGENVGGLGGDGLGGAARVTVFNGGTVSIGGSYFAEANGFGGRGIGGGNGLGGIAGAQAGTGLIDIQADATANAIGSGASASIGVGGDGGDGTGGNAFLQASGTLTTIGTLSIGGNASVAATGGGGNGGNGDVVTAAGNGGTATGGQFSTANQADPTFNNGAFVLGGGDNGVLTVVGSTQANAGADGGRGGDSGVVQNGGDGGDGFGGLVQVGQALFGGDGSVGLGTATFGEVTIGASGDGGAGGTGIVDGNGGNGTGGRNVFAGVAGTVTADAVNLRVDADRGRGFVGGDLVAGQVEVRATTGANVTVASLDVDATSSGGFATTAGSATGGDVLLEADDADLTVNGNIAIRSNATGGGSTAGPGGDVTGGNIELLVLGDLGSLNVTGGLLIEANADANISTSALAGTLATGGSSSIEIDGAGTIDIAFNTTVSVNAIGGNNNGTGAGGDGQAGSSDLVVSNDGALRLGTGYAVNANGFGGTGVGGGNGTGGMIAVAVEAGLIEINAPISQLTANGTGGASTSLVGFGGDGGDGTGGAVTILAQGTEVETGTITSPGVLVTLAQGLGGAGGQGDGSTISAGRGGAGTGGTMEFFAGANNGALSVGSVAFLNADGTGGLGGSGDLGQAGGDGGVGQGGMVSAGVRLTGPDTVTNNGTVNVDGLTLSATGAGGSGGTGGSTFDSQGNGGAGTGGSALLEVALGSFAAGSSDIGIAANGIGGTGALGGNGVGGTQSSISTSNGGSTTANDVIVNALGTGGDGLSGAAGNGTGGTAFIDFSDGTTDIDGSVTVNASGLGGISSSADGASGTGGIASVSIRDPLAGTGSITGNTSVLANGTGGDTDNGFTAGAGIGGEAFVEAQSGGTITLGSAQIIASGLGGTGSDAVGGAGLGGIADIASLDAGSAITIINSTPFNPALDGRLSQGNSMLGANGVGGDSTGGSGIGGTGTGGEVLISATNGGAIALPADPANDANMAGFVRIIARGNGGGSSVDGGAGGLGIGGTGLFEADNGTISTGATIYSVFSLGGASLDPAANVDGGDAEGGSRNVSVSNGGVITAEFAGGISGGFGGAGSGTGIGGTGFGGSQMISVDNATLNLIGTSIFVDQPFGGTGFVGGDAVGGTVDFIVSNGTVTISPNAAGEAVLSIGGAAFGGEGVDQGGDATGETVNVSFDNSTLTGGPLSVGAEAVGGAATGGTGIGGNAVGGEATFLADNTEVDLTGANSVSTNATGGFAETGGNATAGTASFTVSNDVLTINSDGSTLGSLEVSSNAIGGDGFSPVGGAVGGSSTFQSDNNIVSADVITVSATANARSTTSGAISGTASGGDAQARFNGGTDLSVGNLVIAGDAISGLDGSADGGTALLSIGAMAGTGGTPEGNIAELNISANATGASAGANTSGTFRIEALEGRFTFDDVAAAALGDQAQAGEMGTSSIVADGGDVLVNDTLLVDLIADLTVENRQGSILGSFDAASPTADIDISSEGAITFTGDDDTFVGVRGASIDMTSRDLVIEDGARLGAQVVNLVSLNTDDPAVLGGTGAPGSVVAGEGYTATEEELNRINVNFFSFTQSEVVGAGANDPDIIVRDLNFSGAFGSGVQSAIVTADGADSIIRADGTLVIIDAGPVDTLSVRAGDRIEVVTPTSGIGVVDPDDNPTGLVSLTADNIWIGDADLIAQLQADPNFVGRDDQLSVTAAGSEEPLGFLRGGSVELSVSTSLLVRNTGTATEQAGILVGDGGLSIFNSDPMSGVELDVFAYGARRQTDGTFVTGEAFFGEVNFNNGGGTGSTTYSATAELNDCVINTSECEVVTTIIEPEPEPEPGLPEAVIEEAAVINNPTVVEAAISTTQPVTATEQESNDEFGMDFPGLVEESEIEEDTDVEDPVASGGDSSLYGQAGNGTVRVEGN